tara:strand:+ start:1316 stop:1687 length:372 start_codon:yes stop_codon:yes gene_type:complete
MSWKTAAIFLGGLSSGMAYVIACGDKEVDLIDSASADPGDPETEEDTAPPPNNQSGSGRSVVEIVVDSDGDYCRALQNGNWIEEEIGCDCPTGFTWVGWSTNLREDASQYDRYWMHNAVCLEN